jgi:prevent-host-death family protein
MEKVGVRELKTNLSRYLKKAQSGKRLLVTERGRTIATISPVEAHSELEWACRMVAAGRAHWNGVRPAIPKNPVRLRGKITAAAMVIEDRR